MAVPGAGLRSLLALHSLDKRLQSKHLNQVVHGLGKNKMSNIPNSLFPIEDIVILLSTVCADVSAKDGTKPRLPEYCFATASSTAGTASRLRRVTVQPPKPPPVILLPYTPATPSAASTSASSSGQDTSKSSLDTRVEAARGEDT